MAFFTNPLSLNVPDPTFESWLRDSGYLEILDSRSSSTTCQPPTALNKPLTNITKQCEPTKSLFFSILSFWKVLFCLVTINPFAKLSTHDLAGKTPSWTVGFIGRLDSYSWPAGPGQARMRVQENVRRYVKNYAWLGLLFLACSLYQMPVPLLGAVSSLLLWEGVRFFSEKWELGEKYPGIWQIFVRLVQCTTGAILYACNIQLAFFCAISVSYTVMILHASLRKLAPPKLSSSGRIKRLQPRHLILPTVIGKKIVEEKNVYLFLVEGEGAAFARGFELSDIGLNSGLESEKAHAENTVRFHDELLGKTLTAKAYTKLYSFHHIVSGFAIHTTPSEAIKLSLHPNVTHFAKSSLIKPMTTYTPHLLNLPEQVWSNVGGEKQAGEGTVLGVIDTGIDPMHPSFGYDPLTMGNESLYTGNRDCLVRPKFPIGSCNGKIVSAKYYAEGARQVFALDADDFSPYDVVGHGSHVAAIAAGNYGVPVVVNGFDYGRASGMAPRARIAVYKAIYPQGGTLADVIAAVDQAARDRVDVIVLSIGPDETPTDTVTFMNIFDIVLLFARKAGIFVVQAAGNKGPGPSTVISYSPWSMVVASSTTGRNYTSTLLLGNGRRIQGIILSAPTVGNGMFQLKLVSARDAAVLKNDSMSEECQHPESLKLEEVVGSIVICYFSIGFLSGTSTLAAIVDTAKARGFAGFVLVANPSFGDFIAQPLPYSIPGILIPRVEDVNILLQYYNATHKSASASIGEGRIASFNDTAPIVTRSSSRGPDFMDINGTLFDILKPDILAPGNQIWSAWSPVSSLEPILSGINFALLSGTSMATPHVAGVAALVKQKHPWWTPAMIASAISVTASKFDNRGLPIMAQGDGLYSLYSSTPFDHGAGFINVVGAVDPGLVLPADFEDYVSFLCSLPNLSPSQVKQTTGVDCHTTLPSPADLNLPSVTLTSLIRPQTIHRTVKNVAGKPEHYTSAVMIQPDGIAVDILPSSFLIFPNSTQNLVIEFNVTGASDSFSFGEIVLTGSLNHIVRLPLSVFSKTGV